MPTTTSPPSTPPVRRPRTSKPAMAAIDRDGMSVVHLAAEFWPYARTGGLAEAVSGLAAFQAGSGIPTTLVAPLYQAIREQAPGLEPEGPPFTVRVGSREESGRLYRLPEPPGGARTLFIERDEYFARPGIYGQDGGDYGDNAQRFGFFSAAALEVLPRLASGAVVLHAHDWHTALAPLLLRTAFAARSGYDAVAAVLSVHNAGYQGHFGFEALDQLGLPHWLYDIRWLEWYGRVNLLKGGLAFADFVTTVSPTHAHELRTEAGGFGLHDSFIGLRDRLVGILNGIDQDAWNPATDPQIPAPFSAEDRAGKAVCKAELQRQFGLAVQPEIPLFAMSARLVYQKGLDLLLNGQVLNFRDAQYVFVGAGEHRYQAGLSGFASAAPDRVAVNFDFTDALEHRVIAGADMLLMPSLYEPCGLTQMRAQRYGTIPVARRVGGLADTIEDGMTGILFDDYAPADLEVAVRRAIDLYSEPAAWDTHVQEVMTRDFGWPRSGGRYLEVYRRALAARATPRS